MTRYNRSFNGSNNQIMKLSDFKSRSYKDLTKWEWDFLIMNWVCNGCGGAGNSVKNRLIRFIIKWAIKKLRIIFIESSCNIHDLTYWQGWDEARRLECDMWFFKVIISDIERYNMKPIEYIWYVFVALIFYYSVRIGWKSYFNYSCNPEK